MKQMGAIISPLLGGDLLVELDDGTVWQARSDMHGEAWLHGPAGEKLGPYESTVTAVEALVRA